MATQLVESLDALEELMDQVGPLWIRYTADVETDILRGYSTNYATGQSEAGLSVENLVDAGGTWPRHDRNYLAMQVCSYSHMRIGIGTEAWLLTGTVRGRGSDNEPLLTNASLIARLSNEAVEEAQVIERARRDQTAARMGWTYTSYTREEAEQRFLP